MVRQFVWDHGLKFSCMTPLALGPKRTSVFKDRWGKSRKLRTGNPIWATHHHPPDPWLEIMAGTRRASSVAITEISEAACNGVDNQ